MKATTKKLLTVLLSLCIVFAMLPVGALAASTETADFTAPDGGAAAIALLNRAKTGTAESTWDSAAKTLTLRGVNFTTTATTAVKLPDGATVILADGSENTIVGGGSQVDIGGSYRNKIYVYGIYADGALTVRGEAQGTGKLSVTSGDHINSGDAWTTSAAIYVRGALTVQSGNVTAMGGRTSCADCAFSHGVEIAEGGSVTVGGGTLTCIGGESEDTEEPTKVRSSFSRGMEIYNGSITVLGSGTLEGKCVPKMDGEGLAYGVYISVGSLTVIDSGRLIGTATNAVTVYSGSLKLSGGEIRAKATGGSERGLSVTRDSGLGSGNIEISGGKLFTDDIYMYQYQPTDEQGLFTITSGTVEAGRIYGAHKLNALGGSIKSEKVTADAVNVDGSSLTVREAVQKNSYTGTLYVDSAIRCGGLTVNSGSLDVAWDWGEYTPIVFPDDEYEGFPTPLVRMWGETYVAAFNGGKAVFDTGKAGNHVFKLGRLVLGDGIVETGADSNQLQLRDDEPIVFAAAAAAPDYKVTEGANGVWVKDSGSALTFRANGDFAKFGSIKVDGADVSVDSYTAKSGSTVIELKAAYLGTLAVGRHTLTVVYSDGECSAEFDVKAESGTSSGSGSSSGGSSSSGSSSSGSSSSGTSSGGSASSGSSSSGSSTSSGSSSSSTGSGTSSSSSATSPKTGDGRSVGAWLIMLAAGAAVCAGAVAMSNRKKRQTE